MLDVHGVSKIYRRGRLEVQALRDVTFRLAAGEAIAIMGPSGSGKSTLLNILSGLDQPTSGTVLVDSARLDQLDVEAATAFRRRNIGFVFQFFNLLPTVSALDNIALPLLAEGRPHREVLTRATHGLVSVGLAPRAEHLPGELSGGEQQRVAIARALVMRPRLLLADEPTGNLDTASGSEILSRLRAAVDAGLALVMVTHSSTAARIADRTLVMRDGQLGN
jgi:ABC-type lipoprotein export system ATPase subunit